ncbi:hypothetical protein [Vibrio mexicanus]|uniref:hypothetical protein n=1 Tax=Vibrio mexicanus TaxID=1004326 RepID=UPI00063CE240|nr:hypothetical protein [Vibrio mexicanus]
MNGQSLRITLRWIHIICALVMGTALYSPLQNNQAFMALVLYAVVPLVALSGVAMWKQGKIMKHLNHNKQNSAKATQ